MHTLMVSIGAHGHVNPGLPVIAELVRRGHRVSYAIPDSFAEVVASTGATPVGYVSQLPDESRADQWPEGGVEAMSLFLDELISVFPQLEAAFEDDRPDLVLYDIAGYAGRALAHRWSLPLLQLSPAMVAWSGFERDMAEAMAFLDEPDGLAYRRRFDAWLSGHGIEVSSDDFTGRPPRAAVLIPKVLQPHADRVDESVFTFVGPALDRRPHQGEWPAPDGPLVLVSLGSAYTDRAGMGGCSEGLYQGVPMVAVPQAVDQFGNAALLEELGVGITVPTDQATPETLHKAVTTLVTSPEVATKLATLSADLAPPPR